MLRNAATMITLCTALLIATTASSSADREFWHYPEFRYTSGLSGGGWGVTSDGMPGFDGAMQLNIPVAYTPHQGFVIGYSSGSYTSTPRLDLSDLLGGDTGSNINGTGYIGLGLGRPGYGLYVVEMPTSIDWEPVQNIQQQVIPETGRRPALAFGVQDILKHRDGFNRERHGARSPYVVATKMFGEDDAPVYLTLGYGKGRFHDSIFGGASWRATEKLTVFAEHDGWVNNIGFGYDLSGLIDEHTIFYGGMVDLERAVIGLSYVYSDLSL